MFKSGRIRVLQESLTASGALVNTEHQEAVTGYVERQGEARAYTESSRSTKSIIFIKNSRRSKKIKTT